MNRDDMNFQGLASDLNRKRDNHNNSSPQFTRRHYIFLASVMRDVYCEFALGDIPDPKEEEIRLDTIKHGIKVFAEALANQNENFDQDLFLNNVFCTNLIKTEGN